MKVNHLRLLLLLFLGFSGSLARSQNLTETKENPTESLINGFHPTDFYYNTIEIPAGLEASPEKEDRINVAIHYKIVAFEQEAVRPLKSLPKIDMEATLARFRKEAVDELGYAAPEPQPQNEVPAAKPSIIPSDNR